MKIIIFGILIFFTSFPTDVYCDYQYKDIITNKMCDNGETSIIDCYKYCSIRGLCIVSHNMVLPLVSATCESNTCICHYYGEKRCI